MARVTFKAALGQSIGTGAFNTVPEMATDAAVPVATMVADAIPVAAALAVLVADAASPTEAHVTTLNAAYATLAADIAALSTASTTDDIRVSIDNAVITTMTHLRRALDAILQAAAGSGKLTS